MNTEHSLDHISIMGFPHRRLQEVSGRDLNPGPALQQASALPLEPCIFCQLNTIRRPNLCICILIANDVQ